MEVLAVSTLVPQFDLLTQFPSDVLNPALAVNHFKHFVFHLSQLAEGQNFEYGFLPSRTVGRSQQFPPD